MMTLIRIFLCKWNCWISMLRSRRGDRSHLPFVILLACCLLMVVLMSSIDLNAAISWADSEPTAPELHDIMSRMYDVEHAVYENKPYKKILYWNRGLTASSKRDNYNFGVGVGKDRFRLAGCPVWQCETSENRSDFQQYDAVLINQRNWNPQDLRLATAQRSSGQRYIFFSFEPPSMPLYFNKSIYWSSLQGLAFNWTMSYRWDSEVVLPFGWMQPNGSIPLHPSPKTYKRFASQRKPVNYAAGKTKMAAFFATNCKEVSSNREKVVAALIDHGIAIDRYGGCNSNLTCGPTAVLDRSGDDAESCLEMCAKTYKFFIALHNSICLDYVGERFLDALRYSMIPVVIDANGNHARLAPPHSFINALDFPSIRHLADYLVKLDQNDDLYNEYFWWRDHYTIRNANVYEGLFYRSFCSLCAALHNPSLHSNARHSNPQTYVDIQHWWETRAQCLTVHIVNGALNAVPLAL